MFASMSELVIRPDMTTVFASDAGSLVTIPAYATQASPIEAQQDAVRNGHSTQNVYVHSNSPNAVESAVSTHSPYTNGHPFDYHVHTEKFLIPLNDYPGDYGFDIYFGEKTVSAPKSAQYTYSPILNKLFVKMNVTCPIQFKCNVPPPQGCIIKATPVFKRPQHMKDIVTRCPNHRITDTSTPSHIPVNHLVRIEMPGNRHTVQYNFSADGRQSVSVLYEDPQVGTDYSTVLFKFMCLSSCVGGINRRPLMLVFTFENVEGQVLGRRVVEMRICSCPGRDRAQEEKRTVRRDHPVHYREEAILDIHDVHEVVGDPPLNLIGKRKRVSDRDDDEYILKIRGKENFEILRKVKEALDLMEFVDPRKQELYRIKEQEEGSRLVQQITAKFVKRDQDHRPTMNGNSQIMQTKALRNPHDLSPSFNY